MNVQVQGFAAGKLVYDNTYILSTTAPLLVNFDYSTVNRVTFTPSGGTWAGYSSSGPFVVIDNLTIDVPEPSTTIFVTIGFISFLYRMSRRQRARNLV